MATDSIIPGASHRQTPPSRYPVPRTGTPFPIPGASHRQTPPSRTLPRNGSRGALQPAPMPPILTWPPERRCRRRLP